MRFATAALLSLAFLVAATPPGSGHGHRHGLQHRELHGHGHEVHERALQYETVTVTTVVYHTVTVEEQLTSLTSSATATLERFPAPPDRQPTNSVQIPQKEAPSAPHFAPSSTPSTPDVNPYKELIPEAGSASILNSCNYTVYVWSISGSPCGHDAECQVIAPGTTYTEKMRKCHNAGISLKISKDKNPTRPMQFEYTVWDNGQTVSYDISYLDCMVNDKNQKDLSACAGHELGIQAVAGTKADTECRNFFCHANEWCSEQAYVVAEFAYQPGAPVGGCGVDKGVAFELCAGNR